MLKLLPPKKVLEKLQKQGKITPNALQILDRVLKSPLDPLDLVKEGIVKHPSELVGLANTIKNTVKNQIIRDTTALKTGLQAAATLYGYAGKLGDKYAMIKYTNGLFENRQELHEKRDRKQKIQLGESLLRELDKQEYPPAIYALAVYSLSQKNEKEASYYMQRAADLGDRMAQFQVANWYLYGEIKQKNLQLAFKYMEKAHNNGLVEATHLLGTFYDQGLLGQPDKQKAFELYQEACDKGLAVSQHNVGMQLLSGEIVKQDLTKAIYYLKLASLQSFYLSQMNLAIIYTRGYGAIKPDKEQAQKYLNLAKSSDQNKDEIAQLQAEIDNLPEKKCSLM
ncbi:hypothetical protein EDD86DRAFT_243680 [Gorgonomyces haynaldii]|nr:hypothetical protein EDD86DRAFT_243680 [Gorgonomyces haynaldii]